MDSHIVSYINLKHNLKNKQLLNWSLELSAYDYDIIRIKGSDCLCRLSISDTLTPILELGSDYNTHDLIQLQNADEILSLCRSYVQC